MSVADRIEAIPRLHGLHYRINVLSGVNQGLDACDLFIFALALPLITKSLGLSSGQDGMLLSAGFVGMFFGAFIFGPIGDAVGRKRALSATIVLYALGTMAVALASNFDVLVVLRVVAGLGLGGLMPLNEAYASEFTSARFRGRYVAFLTVWWSVGVLISTLLGRFLLPTIGWRGFVALSGLCIIQAVVMMFAPESPRWLERKGRTREAHQIADRLGAPAVPERTVADRSLPARLGQRGAMRLMFARPVIVRTVAIMLVYGLAYGAQYGLNTWLPSFLVSLRHLTVTQGLTYSLGLAAASFVAAFLAVGLIDRIGRRPSLIISLALTLVASIVLAIVAGNAGTGLVVSLLLLVITLVEWVSYILVAYVPELFATEIRSTATGWASAVGRLGSVVAPLVFGAFAATFQVNFAIVAGAILVAIVLVLTTVQETRLQSLEKIENSTVNVLADSGAMESFDRAEVAEANDRSTSS